MVIGLSEQVVEFKSVSKKFSLSIDRPRTIQEIFMHLIKRGNNNARTENFWALRDVDLSIYRGETVGFIGPNGAGKSTLLKLISRIIVPTSGTVSIKGRVAALLEVGTGFHPDLSGRENIYLNASLLGMSKQEIQKKLDAIVAFSELENFIDMPVKHYSSGMYMRLGFSVAAHVDPDVLLVDEVLAVGDRAFQEKCKKRVESLGKQGVTILFVSHDLEMVRQVCRRAIWMQNGRVRFDGDVNRAAEAYSGQMAVQLGFTIPEETLSEDTTHVNEGGQRWGSRQVEIMAVKLLDENDCECQTFTTGKTFTVQIDYVAHRQIVEPVFGLAIYRCDGYHVTGPNTRQAGLEIPSIKGPGTIRCRVEQLPLLTGEYALTVAIYDSSQTQAFDHQHMMYNFAVGGGRMLYGVMEWPGNWEISSE
jgi:ABC-type polysaccharide/polyol phosphate transport system ATPase subunit